MVVDDGRDADSDAQSMRLTVNRILEKHGGWKCDGAGCSFRYGASTELLELIAKLAGEQSTPALPSRDEVDTLLRGLRGDDS